LELWHDGMQMRTSAFTPLICCGYLRVWLARDSMIKNVAAIDLR
jgi:hypothetical protein